MRKILGTAVAVALSMMVLPNCCSTANAGLSVSVSLGASSGCPEGYAYEDYDDEEVMDWDNTIILNDNLMGIWIQLPDGTWILRCRSMSYNSGSLEWTFGPWWYDYSITYGCHCAASHISNYCPFHSVRFHPYMSRHYHSWHNRYFVYNHNCYRPRAERHVIVTRGRYVRHDEPVIHRTYQTRRAPEIRRPAHNDRTVIVTRETRQPVRINDNRSTDNVRSSCPATTQRTTVVTREREIVRQPARIDGGTRIQRSDNSGSSNRQTQVSRTTTRERSNGCNSGSSTQSRSATRTTTRSHGGR